MKVRTDPGIVEYIIGTSNNRIRNYNDIKANTLEQNKVIRNTLSSGGTYAKDCLKWMRKDDKIVIRLMKFTSYTTVGCVKLRK